MIAGGWFRQHHRLLGLCSYYYECYKLVIKTGSFFSQKNLYYKADLPNTFLLVTETNKSWLFSCCHLKRLNQPATKKISPLGNFIHLPLVVTLWIPPWLNYILVPGAVKYIGLYNVVTEKKLNSHAWFSNLKRMRKFSSNCFPQFNTILLYFLNGCVLLF